MVAVGLIAFATHLAWVANANELTPANVRMFTGPGWRRPTPLTGTGRWLLTVIVADFAVLKWQEFFRVSSALTQPLVSVPGKRKTAKHL